MQASKFTPIIIATAIMTIISVFPFLNLINVLCCAGVIAGGFAGAAYYAKQLSKSGSLILFKDGAMIGVLSGLLSALLVVLFTTIITMLSSHNPVPDIYKMFDTYGYPLPPEAEKMLKQISDEYNKSGFSITITLVNLAVYIIAYPVFGAAGGIIASTVYGKRKVTE